jgi:hypothetical protein
VATVSDAADLRGKDREHEGAQRTIGVSSTLVGRLISSR